MPTAPSRGLFQKRMVVYFQERLKEECAELDDEAAVEYLLSLDYSVQMAGDPDYHIEKSRKAASRADKKKKSNSIDDAQLCEGDENSDITDDGWNDDPDGDYVPAKGKGRGKRTALSVKSGNLPAGKKSKRSSRD